MTFKMEFTKCKKGFENLDPDTFRLVIKKDDKRIFINTGEINIADVTSLALLLNKFNIYTNINFTPDD